MVPELPSDHHAKFSDLNVLCVLKQITPRELGESEPIFRWWKEHKHPAPLLMSEEEVHHSADCFPIEFHDMKDRRKMLYGPDVIADVHIDSKFYRAQVEHELRSKLFRLRTQAAACIVGSGKAVYVVRGFGLDVLHAGASCAGGWPRSVKSERRAVVRQLGETLQMDVTPFNILLDVREDKSGVDPGDPGELFAQYLECIRRLVEFVDGLEATAVEHGGHT